MVTISPAGLADSSDVLTLFDLTANSQTESRHRTFHQVTVLRQFAKSVLQRHKIEGVSILIAVTPLRVAFHHLNNFSFSCGQNGRPIGHQEVNSIKERPHMRLRTLGTPENVPFVKLVFWYAMDERIRCHQGIYDMPFGDGLPSPRRVHLPACHGVAGSG